VLGNAESGDPAWTVVNKPSLLYVCPVIPAVTGNGLAMRAGMVLEALADSCRVSLLLVPMFGAVDAKMSEHFRRKCEHVVTVPFHTDTQRRIQEAGAAYSGSSFDIIHVFRLVTVPFARPYFTNAEGRARRYLDLDDIESKTHRRIAALCRITGNTALAESEEAESRRAAFLEGAAVRMFDRIYVCSETDRNELSERSRADVVVLRNVVRLPETVPPPNSARPFRFLFLGTLGYYPNADAVRYFCREVLPLIPQSATDFVVDIVGEGRCEGLQELASDVVHLVGPVPEVRPWYERCYALIVPIRAAGGTRIKILEAFSYGRPVITTSVGVEGLDAISGTHLLVADTPEDFAAACLRLMSDRSLAEMLVENARELLHRSYTSDRLKESIAALIQ